MKKLIVTAILALPLIAHADEALLKKNGCVACHQAQVKVVGPALKDIAAKYKDRKDAVTYLTGKIQNGGGGVWGPMPMPKQAHVSAADAKLMAEYILKIK